MKLISNELKYLVDRQNMTGTSVNINVGGGTTGYAFGNGVNVGQVNNINGGVKSLLFEYFKLRAKALVFIVIVVILLIQSTVFTDFGLNIGEAIFDWVKNFLGY